jgi:hypothetical protein
MGFFGLFKSEEEKANERAEEQRVATMTNYLMAMYKGSHKIETTIHEGFEGVSGEPLGHRRHITTAGAMALVCHMFWMLSPPHPRTEEYADEYGKMMVSHYLPKVDTMLSREEMNEAVRTYQELFQETRGHINSVFSGDDQLLQHLQKAVDIIYHRVTGEYSHGAPAMALVTIEVSEAYTEAAELMVPALEELYDM